MKICLNCGDKLLDGAKKCPSCGTKDNGFPIVDPKDKERIEKIIASVPHPKNGTAPKWADNIAMSNMSLKDSIKYAASSEKEKNKIVGDKRKIKQYEDEGVPYCPKCHSTHLSANKKGFGIGKAIVGASVTGSLLGLTAGNINAKKVRITCMNCGYEFWAGEKK